MKVGISNTVQNVSKALSSFKPETKVPMVIAAEGHGPEQIGKFTIDDQKTQSALESMGLRIEPLLHIAHSVVVFQESNLAAVEVSAGDIQELLDASSKMKATGIYMDSPVFPLLNSSKNQIACADVYEADLKGDGVIVGIVDSGVDNSHGLLNIEGSMNFMDDGPEDGDGHGTHVAGIIGCREPSPYHGVAPRARILSARIFDSQGAGGRSSNIAKGVKWLAENRARIINASVGGLTDGPNVLGQMMDVVTKSGILCVVAAGNGGERGWGSVNHPGCIESVLTVGSVSADNNLSYFSSKGPVLGMQYKPDILAPGGGGYGCRGMIISIRSSYSGYADCVFDSNYVALQGTSMAAPHAAGAAAIILQVIDEESIDISGSELPAYIKRALMSSATNLNIDPMEQGTGLINLAAAVDYVRNRSVPDGIQRRPTKAPQYDYTCGSKSLLTKHGLKSLSAIQKLFALPIENYLRNLVDAGGQGSNEAVSAVNSLVPFSVFRESVVAAHRPLGNVPVKYVDPEIRKAFRQFLTEEIEHHVAKSSKTNEHVSV